MGTHKYFWYDYVTASIKHYSDGELEETAEGRRTKGCIDAALEDLRNDDDEFERIHYLFIQTVMLHKAMGFNQALEEFQVSRIFGQKWIVQFVYDVAKKIGF